MLDAFNLVHQQSFVVGEIDVAAHAVVVLHVFVRGPGVFVVKRQVAVGIGAVETGRCHLVRAKEE